MSFKDNERIKDEIITIVERVINNRSESADILWADETLRDEKLMTMIGSEKSVAIPVEDLGANNEGFYFVLLLSKNISTDDAIKALDNSIEKYFCDNSNERLEELKKNKKVTTIVIADSMERSALYMKALGEHKSYMLEQYGKKAKIEYTYSVVSRGRTKDLAIENIDRYCVIQEPKLSYFIEANKENKVAYNGYVLSVDLIQLIKLYNQVGDVLFEKNVRYGIGEQLGVNKAIEDTLSNEPELFWYKNNGVTILVESDDFIMSYPNKIVFNKKDSIFVINGAQTLSVAAGFYYQTFSESQDPKQKEEKGKLLKNFQKAKVLLRIINIKNNAPTELGRDISVALNRQKPIKIEDIFYSSDYITSLIEIMDSNKDELGNKYFTLKKRGKQNSDSYAIDLNHFARIQVSCAGDPSRARNSSINSLLKLDGDGKPTLNKIFPEIKSVTDVKKHYGAVRFAFELSLQYDMCKKNILNDPQTSENIKILVNNTKWFFISHIISILNWAHAGFEKFDYDIKDFDTNTMMTEFFNGLEPQVGTITLNMFKKFEWFGNTIPIHLSCLDGKIDK